jgi:hypothetical protein
MTRTSATFRFACVVLSSLGLMTVACKKPGGGSATGTSPAAPDAPAPGTPLTLSWEQPYKLATGTKAEGTFFATKDANKPPLKLEASFHDFAKGTKIKVGSDEGTFGDSSYWSTLIDLKPTILKQTLDDLKGPIDVDVEISITPPGAPAQTTKLQKQDVKESLRFALLKARDGGVTFAADDAAAAGKPRGAAVIAGYSDLDFVGSAKTVKELDWVVIAEDQKAPRGTKSCKFKEGSSTLKIIDADAIAYDRRTGQKVGQTVLKASDECPMFALVNKDDNSTKSTVNARDAVAWARAALASGPSAPAKTEQQGHAADPSPSTGNRITQ